MFEKLKQKILNDTGHELVDFKRTYASRQMKGSGAFAWVAKHKEGNFDVGSICTAKELLSRDKLEIETDHYGCNWVIL